MGVQPVAQLQCSQSVLCFNLPSFCSPHPGFLQFPSPTQPSVLLGEDPPPYSPLTSPESGSAPVISCRVCQSLISVEGKIHQHVVKCGVCNEATVGHSFMFHTHYRSFQNVGIKITSVDPLQRQTLCYLLAWSARLKLQLVTR